MLPSDPGTWRVSASLTSAKFDIEHIADDEPENPEPYWHVQSLILTDLTVTVGRGLRSGIGLEVLVPMRLVRDRVNYLDLARQPYTPPNPGLHHRNETLTGLSDPQLTVHFGRKRGDWAMAGRLGLSVPVGRTEPNPFELGSRGLWHQHIQFGSGTWDPILGAACGRSIGAFDVRLNAFSRLPVAENKHGYQAGSRYSLLLDAAYKLPRAWSVNAGLMLEREKGERWGGRIETEGNLGRTDLFLSLGAGRAFASFGTLSLNLQVPLASKSTGEQVKIPLIFSLAWDR